MKKAKGFTLVELIVAMAVFAILMAGIMQIAVPMSDAAASNKVINNQRIIENNIVTYLGETLRYATNLVVIDDYDASLTPKQAIEEFAAMNPVKANGDGYFADPNNPTDAEMLKVRVICFDHKDEYTFNNTAFKGKGRLISSVKNRTDNNLQFTNIKQDGTANLYEVFGNAYYDTADYTLSAQVDKGLLYLNVDSDYYYNANRSGKFSNSSDNPVEAVYELRNATRSSGRVIESIKRGTGATAGHTADHTAVADRTSSSRIYFVYTYPEHYTD